MFDEFKTYYEGNKIKDVGDDESIKQYIFILESPHKDEVQNRIPAVGDTGKNMAKFLGLTESSLGEYVNRLNGKSNIVVMNVSLAPLQKVDSIGVSDDMINKIDKNIRNGYKYFRQHEDSNLNEIEKFLLKDFKKRFEKIQLDSNTKVILCGKFVQTYFDKGNLIEKCKESKILSVPHPSRNQWNKMKDDLEQLEGILKDF